MRGGDQFVDLSYCLPLVVLSQVSLQLVYYSASCPVRQPSSAGASAGASASSVTSGSGSTTPTASKYSIAP